MSKIKFTIGKSNGVTFNLPTRAAGDSNTCMGKVLVNAPGLNCSNSLSFAKSELIIFRNEVEEMHRSIKGAAKINSKCNSFNLIVSCTAKGHIKVDVTLSKFEFASPENSEWQTKICFYDYLDSLTQLIDSKDEIRS